MAQQFVTDAGTLIIPSAVSSIKVEQSNSGLSTTGVLMLVGEADAGPDWTEEEDLSLNAFGADQIAEVLTKYKSGPLVDAYRGAIAASNDPNIQGAPSRILLAKTNVSTKASSALTDYADAAWGSLYDKSYGKLGNLIYYTVTAKTSEVAPTTGAFSMVLPIASTNINLRAKGGAATALTLGALSTPAAFVSAVNGATMGITATGGAEVGGGGGILSGVGGGDTIALAATGNNVVVTISGFTFAATPSVGDVMYIPASSQLASVQTENAGSYVITGATDTTISAVKVLDVTGDPDELTAPTTQTALACVDGDIEVYGSVTLTLTTADPINGLGKTMEVTELTSGTGLLSYILFELGTSTPVDFISTNAAPYVISSASEYQARLTVNRQVDGISETMYAGGQIALKLGYEGTEASCALADGEMVLTLTGGDSAGDSPITVPLADYPTLNDLAVYLNQLAGFSCSVGTAIMGQLPSTALDEGTFTFASTHGAQAARLKVDAYKFYNKVSEESVLVQINDPSEQPVSGLPQPTALTYLSGGAKGHSTDALVTAAIDALESVRGNFLVPLFSNDATDDIADGLTDADSTYTIETINAYCRTHVLAMSTLKRRRNRQAFLSIRTTFEAAKEAAANTASFRCSMVFQDAKAASNTGIVQYRPWMSAVKAAGMQAAGFYRPIVHKFVNLSAAVQAEADFNDQNDTDLEDALLSGLLPLQRAETGGYRWVSDQTTYGKDSNFVFNSIQATYVADTIALTTARRMEDAFVGESIADVKAGLALAYLETIMNDFLRLKLIAPSDDAPAGYKNPVVKISGPAMIVSVEVKLAGAIYFIPISFLVTQVTQTASG